MLRDVYSDQMDCLNKANEQMAPLDARWQDLNQNWNPSGYFEPGAIRQGVASVQAALSQAFDALARAQHSCDEAPGCEWPATSDYQDLVKATNQSKNYLDEADRIEASASAAFKTGYVYAPGFKDWAVSALMAASSAGVTASTVTCLMPWWAAIISGLVQAISAAADVLAGILGVAEDVAVGAYKAGTAIVGAAKEGIGIVAWMLSNLPLVAGLAVIGVGGLYAWRHRDKLRARFKRGELPPAQE